MSMSRSMDEGAIIKYPYADFDQEGKPYLFTKNGATLLSSDDDVNYLNKIFDKKESLQKLVHQLMEEASG